MLCPYCLGAQGGCDECRESAIPVPVPCTSCRKLLSADEIESSSMGRDRVPTCDSCYLRARGLLPECPRVADGEKPCEPCWLGDHAHCEARVVSRTSPRALVVRTDWWLDSANVARLYDWLKAECELDDDEVSYFLHKPWKWTEEWYRMHGIVSDNDNAEAAHG